MSTCHAAVFGATGGIGSALCDALLSRPSLGHVHAVARCPDRIASDDPRLMRHACDLEDPASLQRAAREIADVGPPSLVIVATGLLHDGDGFKPEKDWRQLDAANLERSFRVNTIGPAMIAQAMLDGMQPCGETPAVFAALSARVGSISDNRIGGWYGYRASKAALNMIIRNLAIEAKRKRQQTICVGLHPGTVDTGLSRPFQSATRPGQVVAPETAAANLLRVIDGLTPSHSGLQIAWDGETIAD